jgi:hypothetical protein
MRRATAGLTFPQELSQTDLWKPGVTAIDTQDGAAPCVGSVHVSVAFSAFP